MAVKQIKNQLSSSSWVPPPAQDKGEGTIKSVVCHQRVPGEPIQACSASKRLQGLFMDTVKTAQGARQHLGMALGPS